MSEILFIADLHLSEEKPALTRAFLHFLKHRAHEAKALYILGDFFDFWIGDDCITPWHKGIIKTLREYSKTHKLYFLRGNRDFLVGSKFCRQAGCQQLPDVYVTSIDNHKIILLHGDLLCTKDKRYQLYRSLVHNRITQWMFGRLPVKLRLKIANKIRSMSKNDKQKNTSTDNHSIMDAVSETVIHTMNSHDANIMIHGHTHRPTQHLHVINADKTGTRWVLGDWGTHWWVLSYHNGFFAQESYPIKKQK